MQTKLNFLVGSENMVYPATQLAKGKELIPIPSSLDAGIDRIGAPNKQGECLVQAEQEAGKGTA